RADRTKLCSHSRVQMHSTRVGRRSREANAYCREKNRSAFRARGHPGASALRMFRGPANDVSDVAGTVDTTRDCRARSGVVLFVLVLVFGLATQITNQRHLRRRCPLVHDKRTSVLFSNTSEAKSGRRVTCPWSDRNSYRMLRPST